MKSFLFLASCFAVSAVPSAAEHVAPLTDESPTQDVSMPEGAVEERALPDVSAPESNWIPAASSRTYTLQMPVPEAFKPTFKFGGFIIGKYQATDQEKAVATGFDMRLFRLYGQGYVARDFYYRFQFEVNRSPGVDRGPRVLDAFIEWQRYEALRIKLGQFKRGFAFENPMSPLDIGFGSFAQSTLRLQSINDRIGEHQSSGRDVGVQVSGDFLKVGTTRHNLVHYQVGLYNGQGVNYVDVNNHKDLIAGFWLRPVKDLAIGVFGWEGRYQTTRDGRLLTANRHRYALGLKYEAAWTVRSEYVHSRGGTLTRPEANHSDGWYVAVGAPIAKVPGLKVYGRWDCYRDNANTWDAMRTDWTLAANYWLNKNLLFQLNLTHTDDRANLIDRHYNTLDAQVVARF